MKRNFTLLIVFAGILFSENSLAQAQGRENLPYFDSRYYHFGFLLSANSSSFFVDYKPDFTFSDSLLGIDNVPQAG
ncbi:MAG: hypothetical protein ACKOZM_11230 [Flavobacteriales bacterium]